MPTAGLPMQGIELPEFSDAEIAELVNQARAEALIEARIILRRQMVAQILERAAELEPGCGAEPALAQQPALAAVPPAAQFAAPPGPLPPAPQPQTVAASAARSAPQPADTPTSAAATPDSAADAARLAEIEAIRQKLAENERALQQIKTTPPPGKESAAQAGPPAEAEAPPETGDGFYVYGIVGPDFDPAVLPAVGIAPDRPVYLLPDQHMQAVVSRAPLEEFGQAVIEENTHNPVWLESHVLAHQAILEALVSGGALVPMKFCSLYLSEARIQAMMAQYAGEFSAALANLTGKEEWGIKVYSDPAALNRQVEATSERIQAIQAEIASKTSGMAYFVRKKLEVALGEEAERFSNACAQDSHDRLAACASAAHILPLRDRNITGRADDMALNGAYLVAAGQMDAYRSEIDRLQDEYGPQGFTYELSGPWPPYNFVSIGVE